VQSTEKTSVDDWKVSWGSTHGFPVVGFRKK